MTAKPTFPPAETAAGREVPPPKTALRPGMIVVKKSGDTEFIGLVINITENGAGDRRLLVESLAPGARKILHIYRPDQFREATLVEMNRLQQMTAIWDYMAPTRARLAEIQPGRFPEMGGDPEPIPAAPDPFGTGGDPFPNADDLVLFGTVSAAPTPPPGRDDPEFMPAWAHKALIAIVAIGAAFCAVMVWQSLAAINAGLAPV